MTCVLSPVPIRFRADPLIGCDCAQGGACPTSSKHLNSARGCSIAFLSAFYELHPRVV